jgi:hypothetical protein
MPNESDGDDASSELSDANRFLCGWEIPGKKMLIFNVDETLIHATETPLAIALSFRTGPYSVYKRPFVDDFRAIENEVVDRGRNFLGAPRLAN